MPKAGWTGLLGAVAVASVFVLQCSPVRISYPVLAAAKSQPGKDAGEATKCLFRPQKKLPPSVAKLHLHLQLQIGMDCQIVARRDIPYFTLSFVADSGMASSEVLVSQGARHRAVQTLADVDAFPIDLDENRYMVYAVDANFDGYRDVEIVTGIGQHGNETCVFYLYDPVKHRFVYNKLLSGLSSPKFDPATKQVDAYWIRNSENWDHSIYQFESGKYVLIQEEASDEHGIKTSRIKNGKMVVVSEKPYPADDSQ